MAEMAIGVSLLANKRMATVMHALAKMHWVYVVVFLSAFSTLSFRPELVVRCLYASDWLIV